MADYTFKGLTGVYGTATVADPGVNTLGDLIVAIATAEGLPTDYYAISVEGNPAINDTVLDDSSTTVTASGLTVSDRIICTTRQQGTKERRQIQKLEIAQLKRKGTFRDTGTYTDAEDTPYFRSNNTYDATSLPDTYNGNLPGPDDNPNTGGLIQKRPWVSVGAIAAPNSIAESIDGGTLADLQIWYDGSDSVQFQPTGPSDEQLITQWNDKSGTAKNANPSGGNNAKPTFESSDLQNTHEYVKFDGNDNLTINPFNEIDGAAAFTLLIVSTFDTVSGTEYLVDTTTGDFGIFSDAGTMKLTMNGYAATTNKTVSTDAWYIHTFVYTGGGSPALVYRLNKSGATLSVTSGSVPAATGSTTVMTLGNNDGKTAGLTGSIGEVIMFDKVLSSTEYENLENYLETKWDAIP